MQLEDPKAIKRAARGKGILAVRCLLHVVSQIGEFENLIFDRAAAF